ncbi:hypothetical protein P152DRAFT_513964 [Eremomyces bilateralis CBS 781.70]|uniref:Cell wall protein n=1 Tax=Eremomyces bilateralis CBS 781.70 TaxID=1392243 RepID=A0A6G1G4D3_9PEZI|nr:uncharacterized protein P152DRAFT_513964 [Eremomyces bilateralis CBS 781.70]KAF1812955.1 hypothetical protein P152DRAFT_513964 [Eremomyces bilateralis CBS 781.70]
MEYLSLVSILPALVAAQQQGPANNGNKGINPNPDPNFDPATNPGTLGPFTPARDPSPQATGDPHQVDERSKQAMQLAISNWMTDTGIVTAFLNAGTGAAEGDEFNVIADGAFKAEVDELSQKAVLDSVIGNDPLRGRQSTDHVGSGEEQGKLDDEINQNRCVQILPSIDTYMVVAAEAIGMNAQQRRAVRPDACGNILASQQENVEAFPNVPGAPGGAPPGKGDGIIDGVPGVGQQGAGNLPPADTAFQNQRQAQGSPVQIDGDSQGGGNSTSHAANTRSSSISTRTRTGRNSTAKGAQTAVSSNRENNGSTANKPLDKITTPQLGLPEFSYNKPI